MLVQVTPTTAKVEQAFVRHMRRNASVAAALLLRIVQESSCFVHSTSRIALPKLEKMIKAAWLSMCAGKAEEEFGSEIRAWLAEGTPWEHRAKSAS